MALQQIGEAINPRYMPLKFLSLSTLDISSRHTVYAHYGL